MSNPITSGKVFKHSFPSLTISPRTIVSRLGNKSALNWLCTRGEFPCTINGLGGSNETIRSSLCNIPRHKTPPNSSPPLPPTPWRKIEFHVQSSIYCYTKIYNFLKKLLNTTRSQLEEKQKKLSNLSIGLLVKNSVR